MKQYASSLVAAIILIVAITGTIAQKHRTSIPVDHTPRITLGDGSPKSVPGVATIDLPIGETEAVDVRARTLLGFDDFVHRKYSGDGKAFSIYVAFWKPGKRSPSHIGAHVPDRCWPMVGMHYLSGENFYAKTNVDGVVPGHWRRYRRPDGSNVEVVFWHIVGGRTRLYRGGSSASAASRLAAVIGEFFSRPEEQVFIREVSDGTMADLMTWNVYSDVMRAASSIGLFGSKRS